MSPKTLRRAFRLSRAETRKVSKMLEKLALRYKTLLDYIKTYDPDYRN